MNTFLPKMSSVFAEQNPNLLPSHHLFSTTTAKTLLRGLTDSPPRKLLLTRLPSFNPLLEIPNSFFPNAADDADDSSDDNPYSSDYFRMYEFKVRQCTRSRSHDWTDCPFAHPGEKARRRDPRRYHYSGAVCPEFRRGGGSCSRGDDCEYAHGVFEVWLHPARYHTEACKDGPNCKRKVCFFAHTPRQLRVLPPVDLPSPPHALFSENNKHRSSIRTLTSCPDNCTRCCLFRRSSPTSTSMGVSNFSSSPPPMSRSEFSPIYYRDVLKELLSSLEGVNLNDETTSPGLVGTANTTRKMKVPWINDVSSNGEDQSRFRSSSIDFFAEECSKKCLNEDKFDVNDSGLACPDLGWVNDLLM